MITHSQSCLMRNCFAFYFAIFITMVSFDGTRKHLIEISIVFTFAFVFPSTLQMHSRFLMFVWRKKLMLFATGILMVLAILLWGFVYSSNVNHDDTHKGPSIKVTS